MHAQQGQDELLNQMEVVNASLTTACQQGTDMQMGTTEKEADITGVGNRTWSSDMSLELLDLPCDSMPTTTDMLRTPSGAIGYQQCISTEAATDLVLAQPRHIQAVMNPGVMATGVVRPSASAAGSAGDGQPAAQTGCGGSATIVNLNMTIP
jgi:hypothetical protein